MQEITEITTKLKALAKELNVPILALSQLSRQVESRDDSRAMLRDRVSALRHANIYEAQRYRHGVSSVLVERIDARTARASSNFQVVRIMQTGESVLFASGRYLDRIRLNGKAPQFEERIVVLDSRSVDTLLAIPI